MLMGGAGRWQAVRARYRAYTQCPGAKRPPGGKRADLEHTARVDARVAQREQSRGEDQQRDRANGDWRIAGAEEAVAEDRDDVERGIGVARRADRRGDLVVRVERP